MTDTVERRARELAEQFHETYERLAPSFGYATRQATARSWDEIADDEPNKKLMIAVCKEILSTRPTMTEEKAEGLMKNKIISIISEMDNGSHSSNQLQGVDEALTELFQDEINKYRDALIWCSGSADFDVGGIARIGWEKICEPLIGISRFSQKEKP